MHNARTSPANYRAGDGARTRDIKLGRLALYQLSYSRKPALLFPCTPTLPSHSSSLTPAPRWWGKDSNLRRREPADLQSAPVGHLGTPPHLLSRLTKVFSLVARCISTASCSLPLLASRKGETRTDSNASKRTCLLRFGRVLREPCKVGGFKGLVNGRWRAARCARGEAHPDVPRARCQD